MLASLNSSGSAHGAASGSHSHALNLPTVRSVGAGPWGRQKNGTGMTESRSPIVEETGET